MRISRSVSLAVVAVLLTCAAQASSLFLNVPGLNGQNPTPGFPKAIAIQTLSVSSSGFSVVKQIDATTPQIQQAVVLGNGFAGAQFMMYNAAAPATAPDQGLSFTSLLASGQSFVGTSERDTFAETNYLSFFLYLPGLNGNENVPGYASVLQLDSFTVGGDFFSVVRKPDSLSPEILAEVLVGKSYPGASLLIYDQSNPTGQPTAILNFETISPSGFSVTPSGDSETDMFSYVDIPTPAPPTEVPEPASASLIVAGAAAITRKIRSLRRLR